ncbi:hypothetical protein JZO66_04525 [Enterococcus sp. DIV0242_7C1]|uniref:Uncharacterized protein n=1 Tax=Candidatus Enterococcus dunnyi TaxID=1834192 RepID=A0A200J6Q4_9ENTE|nr:MULTISPECIES: hypothetical protein [unclassified Enterococcus]MBO0469798.1 hypothetical protein [Enterococcus sp. DIV0242_7C1]OUZ32838.1 hypothetical protein A5889_001547 [Enterococcus sp. 9D6_DIV0238]
MDQEEQALADYQQARRQLEEESDALTRIRRQAEQVTNETYSEIQRQVQRFGETNEPMEWARHELPRLEEDFFSELDREKQTLLLKEDEAEQAYRKKLQEQTKP